MRIGLVSTAILLLAAWLSAAAGDEAGNEFFEKKIRPILVEHCYKCHSAAAKKPEGGLLLDSREGLRTGGDTGPALEPGKPDKSLLISALRYDDDALKMPPTGKLPDALIADLEAWIKMGAPDPREKTGPAKSAESWPEVLASRRDWWSLQAVKNPPVPLPKNADWSSQTVDRFVLAKLEERGLPPAAPADPRTLIRRLSLVLIGLPPTPEQVEAFVKEYEAAPTAATETLVDSLLASPHFGERWARHWMDVVRFSETHGNEWNYEVHHAWQYRDYLIRAFNDDLPFDQLVREHIAGDLLPPRWNEKEQFNEAIIGTAFYRFGEVNHDDCIGLKQIGYDLADNQIDTLTKAFQGTTVACARCHDHKLDAISMQDYYGLLGILRSSRLVSHTIDSPAVNVQATEKLGSLKEQIRKELAEIWLREAGQTKAYMVAAHAKKANLSGADELAKGLDAARLEKWVAVLKADTLAMDHPLQPWRELSAVAVTNLAEFSSAWKQLAQTHAKEERERSEFNQKSFEVLADFTAAGGATTWQVGGQGLRSGPTPSGEPVISTDGDSLIAAVLPAGTFTHSLSSKLNGTLRSPPLAGTKNHISFQVMGERSSALRLVSNNCQLNYKNYHALTTPDLHWVTFSPPDDRESLRVYGELMTMFDNPKFPDQLSALGGDKANYRLPWEKAAENPRSYFGITRVVLHDGSEPPKPELSHLRPLFAGTEPAALADVAARYEEVVRSSLQAWADGKATDDDARWLDLLVEHGLLSNSIHLSPRLETLAKEYRETEAALAIPRVIPGIADCGPGFDQPVFVRGDCIRPGEPTPRRYLEVLSATNAPFATSGSGRLELAQRIASRDNPLTARVMVNRIWQHVFGSGLVRTVDDFGHVGDRPSHPELLDYLAVKFVEEGWSVKRLIRSLVLTKTFQLANQPAAEAKVRDPENRLLSYFPARRMEAEAIRDSILAASGRLDRTMFGMSIQPFREGEIADRRLFPGPLDGNGRRSIYIKNNLMEAPQFLGSFNFPGGKVAQGKRDVTNVPAQALALLNDPFVLQQADDWAQKLIARSDSSMETRIEAMFQSALGRAPRDDERTRFREAVQQLARLHGVSETEIMKSRPVWKDAAHAMFNLQEFIYIP